MYPEEPTAAWVQPLPPTLSCVFSNIERRGRFSVPPCLRLNAAFGSLRLDFREALFPEKETVLVANSVCSSVQIVLPPGATVVDHSAAAFSSHRLAQEAEDYGPVIHLEGFSLFSDVKLVTA